MKAHTPRRAAIAGVSALVLIVAGCSSHKPRGDRSTSVGASTGASTPTVEPPQAQSTIPLPIPSASAPSANGAGVLAVRVQGSGTKQWPLRGISCTTNGFTSDGAVAVTSTPTSLTIHSGTPVDGLTISGKTARSGSTRVFSGQADTVTVQVRAQC